MTQEINLVQIFESIPKDFNLQLHISGCYLVIEEKLLLLKRASKEEHGKWGVPAGKIKPKETPIEAASRELMEETGINLPTSQLLSLGTIYIRKPTRDYVYHMFDVKVHTMPKVCLSEEHTDYVWASKDEFIGLDLVPGAKEAYLHYYKLFSLKTC